MLDKIIAISIIKFNFMKITIFTLNQNRHNKLISLLSEIADELYVVQENITVYPGIIPGRYKASSIMKKYFEKVTSAQNYFFPDTYIKTKNSKIYFKSILAGELNLLKKDDLNKFLESDVYIVFGSSYIKGWLIDFLVFKKAINIHMGVSPYYRGTDCNFWAVYDNNLMFVGATIHLLSKGIDSGPILYHALSKKNNDIFLYTMSTVYSAFISLIERLNDKSFFQLKSLKQDTKLEIRYSKNNDFNEIIIQKFFKESKKFNKNYEIELSFFKDPFILKKY